MKVLQITSHYDQGGAGRIAACLHRQLLSEGIESVVVYGRGKETTDTGVVKFDKEYEIYLSALLSRLTGLNGWWNLRGTKRLIRQLEECRPDIIHIHALHGYYVNFPKLWKYIGEKQIPVVWTFHDCHAFTGNCGYFFECDRWKNGCGHCPALRGYPASQWFDFTRWMWKRKKKLFTAGDKMILVSPSDWLTECAKKSFFQKYSCVTIHNGIDTVNTFRPLDQDTMKEKYGYQADKIVLGIAVGYKDPRKGAKYIIQMAKDLGKEAKVILIGWEECNNSMLQGCDNIITLPAVNDSRMLAEYYSMADVFVLPSLAENYATTALEAMACGTAVVGFQTGGIPEQLADGRGIAVKAGDQEAFTEAVRRVLREPECVLHGETLAAVVRKENSIEKMTAEYRKVYQRVSE